MSENKEQKHKEYLSARAIAPGVRIIIKIGQRVRNSILDYALGAAILGIVPVYGSWIPEIRLTLLLILNIKMIVNIGRFWGYHRGQDKFAIFSCVLGILAAFILGTIAWITVFAIGLFIPLLDGLARALAYGVLTWNIGFAVSKYYYSPRRLNTEALQKAIQFQRSQRQRR